MRPEILETQLRLGSFVIPLLLLVSACQQAKAPDTARAMPGVTTATDFSGANLKDTTEDRTYVAPGEDLAKSAGAGMIGKPAPLAVMQTIDGKTIDLGQSYGKKPVYIKFWATWCVPCRQQMPAFEKRFERQGDKMQIVALNIGLSDDLQSIKAFREKYGIKMPIVMDDGRMAQLFNLRVTPQHVLIGRDARFAYFGHAENQALDDAIVHVLAEPVSSGPLLNAVAAPSGSAGYKVGDVVAGLAATTTGGARVSLAGAGPDRLRAVMFFSSWCEWYLEKSRPGTAKACARARETVARMAADTSVKVDWLGVAGGPWATAQDLADYTAKHRITIPLALDQGGALFRAFGIRDIPTIAVIDHQGRIVRLLRPDEPDLAAAIRAARTAA